MPQSNRLAKSITQLTLCQVTSEVDAATKLLDKACQKLQGIQNIPSQRVTDLEAAIRQLRQITGEAPFCAPAFSYVVRTKKGPLLCHTCTWFVTRKAPCYLAVTWERRRTKILKGLCGVIGWFQVAADIGLPLK